MEEDAHRLLRCLQNQFRIADAAVKLRKAAHEAQDSLEAVGPHPGGRECAASTAAPTANRPAIGIVRDRITTLNRRKDLGQEERCVRVAECVVLYVPAAWLARSDEDTNGHGHLAVVDQVVKNDRRAVLAVEVEIPLGVLEEHQRRWLRIGVLGRHVHPVASVRPREDTARVPFVLVKLAAWDAGLGKRVGAVCVTSRKLERMADVRNLKHFLPPRATHSYKCGSPKAPQVRNCPNALFPGFIPIRSYVFSVMGKPTNRP